jgi:hypothetical protein
MSYPPGMGSNAYPTQNPVNAGQGQLVQEQHQNAFMNRFDVMATPSLRDQYARIAQNYGIQINPDGGLIPLCLTAQTRITFNSTAHPGLPTSLDVVTPEQTSLEIKVEDPVFIRKVTYAINTCVFLPAAISGFSGPPPAPPFEPQVLTEMMRMDPADFIYIQVRRPGGGQVYQDNYITLRQFAGNGSEPYFWSPIPVIPRGGQLLIAASIMPPGQQAFGNVPPFVDRIGFLQISFHCERFAPMGV